MHHILKSGWGGGGRGIRLTLRPLFTNTKLTQKVRLNDKIVGLTKHDRTQRNIGLLFTALKVMSYTF